MYRIFTCIFLFVTTISFGQKVSSRASFDISKADLLKGTYEKDTTANAYFLYEKGHSFFENGNGYNLITEYQAKIKILNKEGFDHATIEILLYKNKTNKERVKDIEAKTYNLVDGKIVTTTLDKKNIFTEAYDDKHTLVKFTFPNVKKGSVLKYSYTRQSPFRFNFKPWHFQSSIPKVYSEYVTDIAGNYVYNTRLTGLLKLTANDISVKRNCLEYRGGYADCSHSVYTMEDIPAFVKERYMTSKYNYLSRIEYELSEFKSPDGGVQKYSKTWKTTDREIKTELEFGLQLKKLSIVQNVLPENIKALPNTLEKAKKIYQHIRDTYQWNGENAGVYKKMLLRETIKNHTGNVKDINIILHNTLKAQGYEVLSILASTRTNGYITKVHPVTADFNYVLVHLKLDDHSYILDATERILPFGQLPFRCLNQYARLMDFKNGSSWVDLPATGNSSYFYFENLKLETDQTIKGEVKHTYSGYHANTKRKKINTLSEEQFIDNVKNIDKVTINDTSIENINMLEKPIIINYKFTKNTELIEDVIYINPFHKPFFTENPFKLQERTYPVDFGYKDSYTYIIKMQIPENYTFIEIPKNVKFALPDNLGKISYATQLNGKMLTINYRIQFGASYYPTLYYDALKEFFSQIITLETNTLLGIKKD